MLTYIKGDIFSSPAQVLVNTVNTVGVMGKGIALEFKNRYPEMFKVYQEICDDNNLEIGKLMLWKKDKRWILLFPTKRHWRSPSKIEYIEKGLEKFVQSYEKLGVESIAFPKLGCGNGGLDWDVVGPMMEKYLKNLPIQVYIYLDNYKEENPEHKQPLEMENWLRSNVKSLGFSFIKEEIKKVINTNNELFVEEGELKHISWEDDGIHLINGSEILITEEDMCDFWNYIRDVGVIDIERLPNRFEDYGLIMLDILRRLEYVQPIIIVNNSDKNLLKSNGYQYVSE
ncbi:macro domain-containing protein [Proteiniborus sp. MB09-C3]|uniref:macro domain-containing protein n=1 Tax=Proteiniborus sp. MB09-C3 TaxID=3050072 RepID=UPI00255383B2|nr:macro domain-containing protein [Proteiniborus sp. MB09-C3]WIV12105.1 macro domain-containing protein [Proteiniborus sp. MB09-C3]